MLKDFYKNLVFIYRAGMPFSEKVSAFFSMTRLLFKIRLFRKKNTEVSESFPGIRMHGYDYLALDFLYKEVFMNNEYYFYTTNKNPVIIDCGANIGMSVLYFKKTFPGAKLLAFEANPGTFKLLEKNIAVNKSNNVEIYNVALYDKEEEIPFFTGEQMGTLIGSVQQNRGGGTSVLVQAKRLSSYLQNFETIDLIKMDVEGAELNIIKDLIEAGSLTKAKQYIVEYHHNINAEKSNLSSFLDQFERHGFDYNIRAEILRQYGYQDVLIHFYKREKME